LKNTKLMDFEAIFYFIHFSISDIKKRYFSYMLSNLIVIVYQFGVLTIITA